MRTEKELLRVKWYERACRLLKRLSSWGRGRGAPLDSENPPDLSELQLRDGIYNFCEVPRSPGEKSGP